MLYIWGGQLGLSQDVSIDKLHDLRHSFDPDENAAEIQNKWTFGGATIPGKESLILLPTVAERFGYMWNKFPVKTNNFELTFDFQFIDPFNQISPRGTQGFALWYSPTPPSPPSTDAATTNDKTLMGRSNQFSGFGLFISLFNRTGGHEGAISAALDDGSRTWNSAVDIPTQNGVFWPPISPGNSISCNVVVSPTGVMVRGRQSKGSAWIPFFNFTRPIQSNSYLGFTAYSGARGTTDTPADSKAVGVLLQDVIMYNLDANSQTGAYDNLQDTLQDQVSQILQLNAKASSPKELATNIQSLTKAVVKLIVETLPIQQQVRHTLTGIESRLDRLNSDISELARRLEHQGNGQTLDSNHHALFQNVAHEISGLKNLFHHHSAEQARVTETLLEANAKPAAGAHLHTIEKRLQKQAKMGWFMFIFLVFTVITAMVIIWLKTREIEKKHLF